MDVFSPECRYLPSGPNAARMQQWRRALALPEDAMTFILEISKFLATVALILVAASLLLLAG